MSLKMLERFRAAELEKEEIKQMMMMIFQMTEEELEEEIYKTLNDSI